MEKIRAYLHSIKTRWPLKNKENKIKKDEFKHTYIVMQGFQHQINQQKYANKHNTAKIFNKYISNKHNGGGSNNIIYTHTHTHTHTYALMTSILYHLLWECKALILMLTLRVALFPPYCNV
jgi:hypothetical protein